MPSRQREHVYHWKHGWIPLTHSAAMSKAKGNRDLAKKYLPDSKRKTPQHLLDYHAEQNEQRRRFEEFVGGGISITDTHTQEYKDYFGVGDHRATEKMEERLTYQRHLEGMRARNADDKARGASYKAGVELGKRHHAADLDTETENAEFDAAVKKVTHEEHFEQGYGDGLIAAYEKHAKKRPPKGVAAMADIIGLEIARPGEWELSTGPLTVTHAMLLSAVTKAAAAGTGFRAPVKLGHVDPRFDGEPALGWLHNLRVEGSDADAVLLADVTGMPDWLANLGPSAYPDRSVEGWANPEGDTFEITALALLGVTPPGMSTIRSLRDIPQALGVAAATAGRPVMVAASFTATRDATTQPPPTPAPQGDGSTRTQEGSPAVPLTEEQLTNARQRLGLATDADETAVMAALTAAASPPAPDPAPQPNPAPQPADPAQPTVPQPQSVAASGVTTTIDTAVLAAIQAQAAKGEQAFAAMQAADRDRLIEAAVIDGKLPRSRVEHWRSYWKSDPEGAKSALAAMPKNLVPVAATGWAGGLEEEEDDEFAFLFPPTGKAN